MNKNIVIHIFFSISLLASCSMHSMDLDTPNPLDNLKGLFCGITENPFLTRQIVDAMIPLGKPLTFGRNNDGSIISGTNLGAVFLLKNFQLKVLKKPAITQANCSSECGSPLTREKRCKHCVNAIYSRPTGGFIFEQDKKLNIYGSNNIPEKTFPLKHVCIKDIVESQDKELLAYVAINNYPDSPLRQQESYPRKVVLLNSQTGQKNQLARFGGLDSSWLFFF